VEYYGIDNAKQKTIDYGKYLGLYKDDTTDPFFHKFPDEPRCDFEKKNM
jgi:hypothetical protein